MGANWLFLRSVSNFAIMDGLEDAFISIDMSLFWLAQGVVKMARSGKH